MLIYETITLILSIIMIYNMSLIIFFNYSINNEDNIFFYSFFILTLEILISINTCYLNKGILEENRKLIIQKYLK